MIEAIAKKTAALALTLGLAMVPNVAFAATETATYWAGISSTQLVAGSAESIPSATTEEAEAQLRAERAKREESQAQLKALIDAQEAAAEVAAAAEEAATEAETAAEAEARKQLTDKVLEYDRADIQAIGTQEQTGHTICCPSFSCAYGDAVLDGTVHDHGYYTCSCCTWTDWGGGESSFRCVGSDEELLREAYDQIRADKPTVVHVFGATGEHWICLIGYQNASDPDHLTVDNFIALDPWDGAEIVVSERWALYGDGCEHISTR